jgi:hypothetical protein
MGHPECGQPDQLWQRNWKFFMPTPLRELVGQHRKAASFKLTSGPEQLAVS